LNPKKQTLEEFKLELVSTWIIWRNWMIMDWAAELVTFVRRRPVTDYYPDMRLGDKFIEWVETYYPDWEFPIYGYEDEDEEPYTQEERDAADECVYYFAAHNLALMAWVAFEPAEPYRPGEWESLDYTPEEIDDHFRFKMNYSPRPGRRKIEAAAGQQLSMF
jgi:hypothetical protein